MALVQLCTAPANATSRARPAALRQRRLLGTLSAAFLDAPPGLVVAVANTYREAASA